MPWNLDNLLFKLLAADAEVASTSLMDRLQDGIALIFSLLIGLGAFYMGRAIPRMMVEGKRLLELISGAAISVVLFWVAWKSLSEASWGTILLLVSLVGGCLAVLPGRSIAARMRVRSDTWRHLFGFAAFGLLLMGFSYLLPMLQDTDDAASADKGFRAFGLLILVVSCAYLVARVFVDRIRSPEYTGKIALMLITLSVAVVVVAPMDFKFGVDLRGGTSLIYQLKPEENEGDAPPIDALIQALRRRINPGGNREMVLRAYGSRQIEIIVPDATDSEIKQIKKRITQSGLLQFRIVANMHDHRLRIERARKQGPVDIVYDDPTLPANERRAEAQWVKVARADEKPDANEHRAIKYDASNDTIRDAKTKQLIDMNDEAYRALWNRSINDEEDFDEFLRVVGIKDVEILMAIESDARLNIEGGDLGVIRAGFDERGGFSVDFAMRMEAASRFKKLTNKYRPQQNPKVTRQLGIVLDNQLLSAPTIQGVISDRGQITGNFTQEEVSFLVGILRAGRLPATLEEEPISEDKMGAELGEETIRKGKWAIGISLIAVVVFIIYYYRFAGVVAVLALAANLLLILALMKLINAAFTLPGIAGLVLTVGMSVDANVLIFERIREELDRGSSLRMAIRNGFGRATVTIVDANLTTLITAIVLYMIGTDQIRGFAITLILGILMSMFTAIFCSRAVFELMEKSRKISRLNMRSLVGATSFDFIGKRGMAAVASLLVIVVGMVAVVKRGEGIYAIDFLGGTSVTMQFNSALDDREVTRRIEAAVMNETLRSGPLKDQLDELQYSVHKVDMGGKADTVWRLATSFTSPALLREFVQVAFSEDGVLMLSTYQVELGQVAMASAHRSQDRGSGADGDGPGEQADSGDSSECFISAQDEEQDAGSGDEDSGSEEAAPDDGSGAAGSSIIESSGIIRFGIEQQGKDKGGVIAATLREMIKEAAGTLSITITDNGITVYPEGEPTWDEETESSKKKTNWQVTLQENVENTTQILERLRDDLSGEPYFHSSSTIGGKVADDTKQLALVALFGSLFGIVAYIWFRFQRVAFGLAAVVALVHDVLVTLGAIAMSRWVAVEFLQLEEFRISLPVVAAFLTIIGYSLNDTIVVFDRIREVRGKNPQLTGEMINQSINRTLSRTLLTSLTTLIVVLILFFLGGQGIHGFAFSLVIGVLVGTYSSVFVASPVLLFLVSRKEQPARS